MQKASVAAFWEVLLPGRRAPLVDRRRAEAINARVRAFAAVFAVLTLAWIAVDAVAFEASGLAPLAITRMVTGALFALLAFSCRGAAPTMRGARLRLALLFAIPAAFFLVAEAVVPRPLPAGLLRGVASAYAFFPFLLAAGIGAFPLAIVESALLAAMLLGIEALALAGQPPAGQLGGPELLWLLLLIASAAAFAAASQLRLIGALVEQAIRDPLTDCLRRESGAELLEAQLLLAVRQQEPLTVLFADIDHFKRVNDAFGHEAGDRVLASTAAALRGMARESDTVIRWGGEEFVVVLPGTTRVEAVTLIGRLRKLGVATLPDGKPVTVSIGVAEYRGDAVSTVAALVALADKRMYRAKQAGRNRYVLDGGDAYPIVQIS